MARLSVINREKKRTLCVAKNKKKRTEILSVLSSTSSSIQEKNLARKRLAVMPKDSSLVRSRSRCALTGKGRSVYKQFGLGRFKLRELMMMGVVPGVVKASW
jgi:small subunit ribosomal protein S14